MATNRPTLAERIEARKHEMARAAIKRGVFIIDYATEAEIVAKAQQYYLAGNREMMEYCLDRLPSGLAESTRMSMWTIDPAIGHN